MDQNLSQTDPTVLWAMAARESRRSPRRQLLTLLQVTVSALAVMLAVGAVLVLQGPRMIGWTGMVVLSGSMEPTMPVGGLAMLAPIDPEDVEVGDVISYRHPLEREKLVSHRVIEIP
jgi:signal peptidase